MSAPQGKVRFSHAGRRRGGAFCSHGRLPRPLPRAAGPGLACAVCPELGGCSQVTTQGGRSMVACPAGRPALLMQPLRSTHRGSGGAGPRQVVWLPQVSPRWLRARQCQPATAHHLLSEVKLFVLRRQSYAAATEPVGPGSPRWWLSGLLQRRLQPPVLQLQGARALEPRVGLSPGPHVLLRIHHHSDPSEAGVYASFLLMAQN